MKSRRIFVLLALLNLPSFASAQTISSPLPPQVLPTPVANPVTATVSGTLKEAITDQSFRILQPIAWHRILAFPDDKRLTGSKPISTYVTSIPKGLGRQVWGDFSLQLPVGWNYLYLESHSHWLLASTLDSKTAAGMGLRNARARRIYVPPTGISNLVLRVAPREIITPKTQIVHRQILKPDGTPAAYADAYIRFNKCQQSAKSKNSG